jgi:hypothetical protein
MTERVAEDEDTSTIGHHRLWTGDGIVAFKDSLTEPGRCMFGQIHRPFPVIACRLFAHSKASGGVDGPASLRSTPWLRHCSTSHLRPPVLHNCILHSSRPELFA